MQYCVCVCVCVCNRIPFILQECADVNIPISVIIDHNTTTRNSFIVPYKYPQGQNTAKQSATVMSWLGVMPQGRQAKGGGSKSSTSSSASSQRSGGGGGGGGSGNRHGNTGSSGDRGRNNRRSLSGSSDSSDDDKDDDDKRRRPYRRKNKEPKSKPGFSDDDEDDEATDSADEGRGHETPNNMTLDFNSQSKKVPASESRRRGESKERFRPSDLSSGGLSKARNSNGSSSSTISVESIKELNRIETGAHVPPSPVNMAVGYGIPSSAAPLVLESNQTTDKSPTEAGKELSTPTMDSPRPLTLKGANSPGTPHPMSPEILPPTFTAEVNSYDIMYMYEFYSCYS